MFQSLIKSTLKRIKPERKSTKLISTSAVLAAFSAFFLLPNIFTPQKAALPLSGFEVEAPTVHYGFALDTFEVAKGVIENNQFLSDLLSEQGLSAQDIDVLAKNTKETFDARNIRSGKPYMVLKNQETGTPEYFIYEPSQYNFLVYDLEALDAKFVQRPIEKKIETASGVINTSLWDAMVGNGYSFDLAVRMEDALAWSIDFHHILQGDRFKLIYEQEYIEGEKVGVGMILGAYYKNGDNEYHAIYFENDIHGGYYDLEGRSMEKAFLKAPVKYSRISSRFSKRRFHPVLKRHKSHLGTDYAAPRGTPIFAVADGIVSTASRTRNNGNFVKLKHDKTYSTQYLHMQKFAKGIRSGVHVKQGQTIGYVGSTGLATGPHVCFRFWKNGRQVNHLKENLPPPEPMPEKDIPAFMKIKDVVKAQLDDIQWRDEDVIGKVDVDANVLNP